MVLVQKRPFFQDFFLGNTGKENVFYDILERRNVFLDYKNKKFKTTKNWHFFKGVNPWCLVQKWPSFQFFFFRQYRQGKCLLRYSRTKKHLSRAEKQKVRKVEKNISKLDNSWFCSKNGHFSKFFFRHYRPGKCLLRYSRTKKHLCSLEKQKVRKAEKLTYFQSW